MRIRVQMRLSLSVLAATFGVLAATNGYAQEKVPVNLALQLMLKVITYDQGFADRGTGDFVVLVPSGPDQAAGLNEALGAAKSMPPKIQNRNIKFVPVAWDQIATAAAAQNASALLLISGATGAEAAAAVQLATSKKLYTLSLNPAFVDERRALLGVGAKDGKPQVVIHLATAKDAGVNFPTTVLKIARTVR